MKFCPHCGGDLAAFFAASGAQSSIAKSIGKYDQTKFWREFMKQAATKQAEPPDITELALRAFNQVDEILKSCDESTVDTIVHVAFDRRIVPEGGSLYMAAMSGGRAGPMGPEYFKARGYLLEDDKVRVADDVPVGQAYGALEYWGGEKQHRRWHLAAPVKLNASRQGDPFFMDENMLAFGASWLDSSKTDAAFLSLFEQFQGSKHGKGVIARPVAVEVVRIRA